MLKFVKSNIKKITLIFLFLLLVINSSLLVPASALAAIPPPSSTSTWYSQDFKSWFEKVYDDKNPSEIFGERYTAAQVQWIIYSLFAFMIKNTSSGGDFMMCLLASSDAASCQDELQNLLEMLRDIQEQQEQEQGYQNLNQQNLLSMIFNTNRPLSGMAYIRNSINRFKIVPEARAQASPGFGFVTALKPIQNFWSNTRDVAYGLFVIVAIAFAFMIMFRVKLSPQTVVSVQSALPKIALSLVAVTFSYAIAGFLVDLMYVVIGLMSLIVGGIAAGEPKFYFSLMTTGPLYLGFLGTVLTAGVLFFLPLVIIIVLGGAISAVFSFGGGAIFALILLALVVIVFLWISIKTFWALIKNFAVFLITIIFSPLTLVLGALIPNFSFGSWVKTISSQLAVFVTVGVLSCLSIVFGIYSIVILIQSVASLAILTSPILALIALLTGISIPEPTPIFTPGWPPLLGIGGGFGIAFLMWAMSFVIFTLIPKAAEIVQGFISGKPFAYGTAIGEAFAPVRWGYGQTLAEPVRLYREALSFERLARFMKKYEDQLENVPIVGKYTEKIKQILERKAAVS